MAIIKRGGFGRNRLSNIFHEGSKIFFGTACVLNITLNTLLQFGNMDPSVVY